MSSLSPRQRFGIPRLDEMLGGGLLPGTLTVVAGATGIGKTQLGLHFAQAGLVDEEERGVLFDMTSRGDSQNHDAYARRLFDWPLAELEAEDPFDPAGSWDRAAARRDYLRIFARSGRERDLYAMQELQELLTSEIT